MPALPEEQRRNNDPDADYASRFHFQYFGAEEYGADGRYGGYGGYANAGGAGGYSGGGYSPSYASWRNRANNRFVCS